MRAVHAEKSITTQAYSPLADGALLRIPRSLPWRQRTANPRRRCWIRWNLQLGNAVITVIGSRGDRGEVFDVFDFELTPAEVESIMAPAPERLPQPAGQVVGRPPQFLGRLRLTGAHSHARRR